MPGSLESLGFLGSQARLGLQERQEGQERGENGVRRGPLESRAETAFPDHLDHLALLGPRWLWMSQVPEPLESKDPRDSRAPRGSQAAMVTEAQKETEVCQAPKESREILDRGGTMASRVCQESEEWLDLRGSRVRRVLGGLLDQLVIMETLDPLVPRVSLVLQDLRVHLA